MCTHTLNSRTLSEPLLKELISLFPIVCLFCRENIMLSTSFNCLHPLVVLHIPPESYLGELGAQRMGLTSGEDLGVKVMGPIQCNIKHF